MQIRKFYRSDYETLVKWWQGRHPVCPIEALPNTGFIATKHDKPVLSMFMILTNAPWIYIDTVAADPESTWQDRERAVKVLVDHISATARKLGYKRIIATIENPRLAEKAEKAGFFIDSPHYFMAAKEC